MPWTLTIEQVRAERDELSNRIGGDELFEQLARGHRWLDRNDKAERWFRKEAVDIERDDADGLAWIGGLLVLAGAPAEAEPWLRRALKPGELALDAEQRAGVHYLLGEHLEASLVAPGSVPAELARARREGDPAQLPAGRARLLEILRSDRSGPTDVAIGNPWTEWDWIEESFIVEARLRGEQVPSHEQMLRALGLYADQAPSRPIKPVPGARAEIVREDELGDPVRTTIALEDDGLVEVILDPRPDSYIALVFEHDEEGWATLLACHPEDSTECIIEPVETFAEAVELAGERLAVPDRELTGAWVTAALSDLIAAISPKAP